MRLILIALILNLFYACSKSTQPDCASDEIAYGELDCIKKQGFTFYQADVNFYCLNRSVLLGLDTLNKILKPYYINTYNPVNSEIMRNVGGINYSLNLLFIGINVECTINNNYKVTWLIIEDKEQFKSIPAVIKAKLMLKESVDYFSTTLEEKDIELIKR